ncbi:hypothetical protein Srufu_013620 [Streptomyces libani subsp. rufus]|nr:hypothetical protein Srufu_013620 [Streptomyces libani subsp. rufus]
MLTIVDGPEPRPLPTEVLVRVQAIGLNPLEARLRAGEFPLIGRPPAWALPMAVGMRSVKCPTGSGVSWEGRRTPWAGIRRLNPPQWGLAGLRSGTPRSA